MSKVYYEIVHTALASKPFTREELIEISDQLSIRNAKLGITGCLVYTKREFFQILEGEKSVLLNLMGTVKDDTRHGNIHIVWEGELPKPNFEAWGLSIKNLSFIGKEYSNYVQAKNPKSTGFDLFNELTGNLIMV